MIRFFFRLFLAVMLVSLLSGCASVLTSYPSRMGKMRHELTPKQLPAAIKQVEQNNDAQNKQLKGVELGRLLQLDGQYAKSQKVYADVIAHVRESQLQAKVRFSHILEDTGSLLVNDRVIPYHLQGYEVVFLYLYQSLNYLAQGDLTDALVSIRRAQSEQQWLKQLQYEELVAAQKKAKEKGWTFRYQDHAKYFQATMEAAKGVKSSFENAALYYLAAVMYYAQGDDNNAFISIKNALALAPDNPVVRQFLLVILQQRGGDLTQLHQYLSNFGLKQAPSVPHNSGLLVVYFDQGLVPEIKSVQVPIPAFHIYQSPIFSFPYYPDKIHAVPSLTVTLGKQSASAHSLMKVYPLAAKALTERYPMIFVREALRVIAKSVVGHELDKHGGGVAGLMAGIYNVVTSGADQRSWLTLPYSVQVWQRFVKQGTHPLTLHWRGQSKQVSVNVHAGGSVLVWVIDTGSGMIAKVIPIQ